jgi:hypothetical protein
MHQAYVVEGEFIDNQTLHISEPIITKKKKVKLIIEELNNNNIEKKRKFGCAKGWFTIKSNFNNPIEDFKEYMKCWN